MNDVQKQVKPPNKRFYAFILIFLGILAITLFSEVPSAKDFKTEKLVLKEAPYFVIERSSGKNATSSSVIRLDFKNFNDILEIGGTDLNLMNRKGLKEDLKAGDEVEVSYSKNYFRVTQILKNGKTYMSPKKADEQDAKFGKFFMWFCAISPIICVIGIIMTKRGVKYSAWKTTLIIAIIGVVLFLFFDAKM
ncbi:MAG: hypothetical protein V4622_11300, partial [Bacteroidota bacterium]